jgi:hypothetical protein
MLIDDLLIFDEFLSPELMQPRRAFLGIGKGRSLGQPASSQVRHIFFGFGWGVRSQESICKIELGFMFGI